MKNLVKSLLIAGSVAIALFACRKSSSGNSSSAGGSQTLTLSATTIQKGQPLLVTAPAGVPAASVKWTVNSSLAHISSGNGQAMVLFANSGTYRVTATYPSAASSHDSATSPIVVSDSSYSPPVTSNYDTLSLAGDQVTLTPLSDTGHTLVLMAQSKNSYDCFPYFMYGGDATVAGSTNIRFYSVISGSMNGNCNGARNPAVSYIFLRWIVQSLGNGTHPFSVTLNNTTYQGTLTISDTAYSFTWDYTSGVTFSTKQVNR